MRCLYPRFLTNTAGIVPCGRCLHCRVDKRRKKSSRIMLEGMLNEHILFVTLTYKDDFLPISAFHPRTGEFWGHPSGTLDIGGFERFIKRLRKRMITNNYKLRYFACGEYGDQNWRPHYHLIIFGLPFKDKNLIYDSWHDPETGQLMCNPDRIDVQIPKKQSDVAGYCTGYIMKNLTRAKTSHQVSQLVCRCPEFVSSSRGIGLPFVDHLVKSIGSSSGKAYIEFSGDIPRQFIIDGKKWPIDSFMRGKILEKLGITEQVKANALAKYQADMQILSQGARSNPAIPSSWLLDVNKIQYGWALEKQFLSEKATEMKNVENKIGLHTKTKGKI